MTTLIRGYLANLSRQLHLEPPEESEILHELQTHIEDRAQELIEAGVSSDEALNHALNDLGGSQRIADQLYEVHSRGSVYHTGLAVLPHILIALMFAFHLWTSIEWAIVMLAVALVISVVGWRKGRPRWTYPWLGYCLVVPIISWGLAMSSVGYGAWAIVTRGELPLGVPIYIASFIYIALSLWIVIKIVSKVARRDWVMASLAIMPIPFLAYWFFYFYTQAEALQAAGQSLREIDSSVAIVFLILAASTAIFFRIGKRLVRVALLVITAPSMIVLAWLSYRGGPGYMAVFTFSAISLAVLLSPMLFDIKDSHSDQAVSPIEESSERSKL
ncbi:MAG: hypothetical protein IIB15_03070 [Chloroflexi bacterium]|nr:hypothetical protein [Chloroflexota bacterium]